MWILWWFNAIGIRGSSPRAASSLALGDVRVALKQITLSFQRGRERDDRENIGTVATHRVMEQRATLARTNRERRCRVQIQRSMHRSNPLVHKCTLRLSAANVFNN